MLIHIRGTAILVRSTVQILTSKNYYTTKRAPHGAARVYLWTPATPLSLHSEDLRDSLISAILVCCVRFSVHSTHLGFVRFLVRFSFVLLFVFRSLSSITNRTSNLFLKSYSFPATMKFSCLYVAFLAAFSRSFSFFKHRTSNAFHHHLPIPFSRSFWVFSWSWFFLEVSFLLGRFAFQFPHRWHTNINARIWSILNSYWFIIPLWSISRQTTPKDVSQSIPCSLDANHGLHKTDQILTRMKTTTHRIESGPLGVGSTLLLSTVRLRVTSNGRIWCFSEKLLTLCRGTNLRLIYVASSTLVV
jgi:hypothetical protein